MNTSGHRQSLVLLVAAAMLVAGAVALPARAANEHRPLTSYGWPVKPFDRQHPVRGYFGDPRTIFHATPTQRGLMTGGGEFGFHQGVDISAPDGAAVYPVVSGTVSSTGDEWVGVDADGGRAFKYWHIRPAVHAHDRVVAGVTVLGHILRGSKHVHLTEYESGRPVNPLAPGHLEPYTDTTSPLIASVTFRGADATPVLPTFVSGSVEMVADAYDQPTMPVPGAWRGMPITPALLTWRIVSCQGRVVVPEHVAYDHRRTEPADAAFWNTYARGTYQNMAVFGGHFSYLQRGVYLFKLTPGSFDTRRLRDGAYELVATAADARGNHSSFVFRFLVRNGV
jgi:peptidase M23-like protein